MVKKVYPAEWLLPTRAAVSLYEGYCIDAIDVRPPGRLSASGAARFDAE
jgi:hypothetical protein